MEVADISVYLEPLVREILPTTVTDEVSLNAIAARWSRWLHDLPELEEMSEEQRRRGRELLQLDESRRLSRLSRSPGDDAAALNTV